MLWRSFEKHGFLNELLSLFAFIAILIICRFSGITCLFYQITSFPCPACNMTSALLSLAKGDISAYASCNIMALPVAAAFLGELFNRHCGKYAKFLHIYSIVALILNLIYYANRMMSNYYETGAL